MTALLCRALATTKGWWSRASTTVLGLLRGVVRVVRTGTVRAIGYAAAVLAAVRARHRERLVRDPGYRSVVASAVSAVLVTVITQPAVADGGFEAYDARRAWSPPSSRPPQRLWDRYTD